MTDNPHDESSETPPDHPSLADQVRAKMDEYEVDRHLNELATTIDHAVRQGLQKAGEYVHEHRGDIEKFFEKVAGAVDTRTDGRHADTIEQVRGSLGRGVEKIAEQRNDGRPDDSGSGSDGGSTGGDVPPSNG
jgi:RNA-splicing ligase RtcB